MLRDARLKLSTFIATVVFVAMAVITAVLGVLAYRLVYRRIQDGFNRKLVAISTVTAAFIDGNEHREMMKLNSEHSPVYLKYVRPMQRIMREQHITYLYTQIPTGGRHIIYGLDGTVGPEHSPISSPDVSPPGEAAGIRDVYRHGIVYLSGMRHWQEWGLLESAFAPIYNRAGAITAMSGADVNISIITEKTRMALLAVTGCGLVLLLLAGFISTRAARRVTGPIGRLKTAALQVAAGHYGLQADIASPTELRTLAGSFNELSRSLDERLRELRQINAGVEEGRRERLLLQVFQRRDLTASPSPAESLRLLPRPSAHECRDASGWVRWQNQLLLWSAGLEPTPLAAARLRHDLATVFQPLLHRHAEDWTALAARLDPLFRDRVGGLLLVNLDRETCLYLERTTPVPLVSGPAFALVPGREQSLPPDRLVTWCTRPDLAAAVRAIAERAAPHPDAVARALDEAGTGGDGLVLAWRTGRAERPLELLRNLLQSRGLISSLLGGLPAPELDLLLGAAQLEQRRVDERLTLQGEQNEQLHLMLDGRVRIDGPGGPLEITGNQWIGEFSLLYGGAANATVTVLAPFTCLVWERAPLIALLQEHPSLERHFLAVLTRAMNAKITQPPFA